MKPSLGAFQGGDAAAIDLPRLLETRMLIQANSGYGKSWAIRRLLEQTAGQVQQFVIDPEGEFATLREKHDYIIAAPHDGDALAHSRTAQLLARRLLETGVSAVLDIYDLKAHERQAFVRLFCEALVNAPKALWQPVLVVLDEAHTFCPEAGKAESAGAVIDLATRGRKRGYALIAATQRLAKLHKDTAAELLNKLVGRTGLDVDVKRAADELGMTPREAMEKLRALEPGQFYAFGPALSPTVRVITTGEVRTTHPKAGQRSLRAPPAPTAAIKAMLPKLADLPKEAETEARTLEDLRRELAGARRELAIARKSAPAPKVPSREQIEKETAEIRRRTRATLVKDFSKLVTDGFKEAQRAIVASMAKINDGAPDSYPVKTRLEPERPRPPPGPPFRNPTHPPASCNGTVDLPKGEAAILSACIQFPEGLRRDQLTVLTGYKRSTRDTYVQRLGEKGYISIQADKVLATDEGTAALPNAQPLPTGEELQRYWLERLPEGERAILKVLVARYPDSVPRDDLTEETGYKRSTRDTYLQRMAAKQLIVEPTRGQIAASETLF